jgi:hypothetical protein
MVDGSDYVTKADLRNELQELRMDMRVGFADLRTEIQRRNSDLRPTFSDRLNDHQRWVLGAILGQYALIIGLYGLIISRLH